MVYIVSWDEFVDRSVQLFRADPESYSIADFELPLVWWLFDRDGFVIDELDSMQTRYVVKYRHCDGKLVLKVTDNKESKCYALDLFVCLKFKTDQAQEAKKMEKLNNIFFTLMARGPDVDLSEVTGKEPMETQPAKKGRGRKQ
ncbi:hypothetical protein Bca4012_094732 [Brassica carinata]